MNQTLEGSAALHLELRILASAEGDTPRSLDRCRRDEPTPSVPDEDEQVVDLWRVELLWG
jgi:hypothetical protein